MINKSHRKIIIAFIALGVIGAGLYWRQPLARATMKLLEVAQGVIRVRSSPKNGLVGHWNFDECDSCTTAADKSGNGNTGTMYKEAGPTVGDLHVASGKIGNGISLDGINDYVGSANNIGISGDAVFTMSAWFKTDSLSAVQTLVFMGDPMTGLAGASLVINVGGNGEISAEFAGGNGARSAAGVVTSTNEWHHFAAVKTSGAINTTTTLYFDGKVIPLSASSANTPNITNTQAYIGTLVVGGYNFDGLMDDVRVYNRALSADEIARLYEEGSHRTTINANQNSSFNSGLVGMWSFNGPDVDWASTTAEILDRSGNSNNGDAIGITNKSARTGMVGQALSFNGTNDYVSVPHATSQNSSSITVGAWVYPRDVTNDDQVTIIGKWDNYIANGQGYITTICGTWGNCNQGRLVGWANTASGYVGIQSSIVVPLNVWSYVAMTYNSLTSTTSLYINGVDKTGGVVYTSGSLSGNILASNAILGVGSNIGASSANTPDRFLNGLIDEARIYNRALNAAEIQELYLSSARQ